MTDDQQFILDLCYPPLCESVHALKHKRLAHFLALKKSQSDDRDLLNYLDYRIEIARKCVQDELRNCEVSAIEDFYHP